MGHVIQFEPSAVATLRTRLGEAQAARADLAAFARGHSGAVAAIHSAVSAALDADGFDALCDVVTNAWPAILEIDCVALALVVGTDGFRIDRHGVSRCAPQLIARATARAGEVALRSVERGDALFGAEADDIRAEALVAIPGDAPFPRGLLLLGQAGVAAQASDEGSQLLQFLGSSLGAMLRRWARDS